MPWNGFCLENVPFSPTLSTLALPETASCGVQCVNVPHNILVYLSNICWTPQMFLRHTFRILLKSVTLIWPWKDTISGQRSALHTNMEVHHLAEWSCCSGVHCYENVCQSTTWKTHWFPWHLVKQADVVYLPLSCSKCLNGSEVFWGSESAF